MPDTPMNPKLDELSRSTDASEQALARYRADPTPDNLIGCLLAYANTATDQIGRLTRRLEAAEAEIKALRMTGAPRPERPRLRPGTSSVPTAPHGGG